MRNIIESLSPEERRKYDYDLLEEKYLTPNALYDSVCDILYNKETARRLSKAIQSFAHPTSKEEIYADLRMLVSRDVLTLLRKKDN